MYISYELKHKQWDMEKIIKETWDKPDFLENHTRNSLRMVMIALFPHTVMTNEAGRAFMGMSKKRMYKHIRAYAILHNWC